jgi:hypothetical protein
MAEDLFGQEREEEAAPSIPTPSGIRSMYVHFETREDMEAFSRLVGQKVDLTTEAIWYPEQKAVFGNVAIARPRIESDVNEEAETGE